MKPKKSAHKNRQRDLFRIELDKIIDPGHSLVKLSDVVHWDQLEAVFGSTYCPDNGRPAVSTRLMVALHYLKYTHNLSDDNVVAVWVENPYWQYFSGMQWFEHKMPIHPSSMCRWRKRIGDAGAEQLLKETIQAGLKLKAVKPFQLKRINVDTTVQEKEVRFPTDSRLYDRARQRLVDAAKKRNLPIRQNYNQKAKQLLFEQSRYSHAKQIKRAKSVLAPYGHTWAALFGILKEGLRNLTKNWLGCWRPASGYTNNSVTTRIRFTVYMPLRWIVSAKAKRINAMSLAARSVWQPHPRGAGS